MHLTKRERKCLDRIKAHKSIPDCGALNFLEDKGVVTITSDGDGGMHIEITEKGWRLSGGPKS